MNSKYYIGKRVSSLEFYEEVGPITGVALLVDNEHEILVGDDTGYTLEIVCPYGTQEMANNILASLFGKVYKGFSGSDAVLDPVAELGDGITIDGVYSFLAQRVVNFGPGHMSDVSAPGESVLQHEYPYQSGTSKEIKRQAAFTRSYIDKSIDEISLRVETVEDNYTSLKLTTDSIALEVSEFRKETDAALDELAGTFTAELKKYSTVEQTSSRISAAVTESKEYTNASVKSLGDEFDKSLGELESGFNSKLSNYSTVEQTATSISSAVSESKRYTDQQTGDVRAALSNYSTIEQTASGISSAVSQSKQYTDGQYQKLDSEWTQTAEGFTASIEGLNGKYLQLTATVDGVSSTVVGVGNEVSILQQTIDGLTITDETGTTWINGSQIFTGTVRADVLIGETVSLLAANGLEVGTLTITPATTSAYGAVEWNSTGALRLQAAEGATWIQGTGGSAAIQLRNDRVTMTQDPDYLLAGGSYLAAVTPGGNNVTSLGASGVLWKDIYCGNAIIQSSDLNVKTDLEYGLSMYDALFDGLRPMSFRFVDGNSGRRHMGLGAQDVERLLAECGLTTQDFATFIKSPKETEDGELIEGEYAYALRYSELIPLCIEQIQKLKARVRALEEAA